MNLYNTVHILCSSSVCNADDLLRDPLSDPPTDGPCFRPCSRGICVRFCDTFIRSTANYTTMPDYCIDDGPLKRECMDDQMWSGRIPDVIEGIHVQSCNHTS